MLVVVLLMVLLLLGVVTLLNVLVARAVVVMVARSGGRHWGRFGGVAAGRLRGGGMSAGGVGRLRTPPDQAED